MSAIEALDRTLLLCRDFVQDAEASNEEIAEALTTTVVTIVADRNNLRTAAAQSAVVALAGQVLGYGCHLRIIMPEVPVVGYQPPLLSGHLREGLVSFASDLIPGGGVEVAERPNTDDFVFIIGSTRWEGSNPRTWRLGGTRWSGVLARPQTNVPVWPDDFPIGALVAATSAAAEPFKGALMRLLARCGSDRRHEELFPSDSARVALGPDHLASEPLALSDLDIVSGGAITNGALHTLLRIPELNGRVRVFEPEVLEVTNLNRYALARFFQLGLLKIDALSTWQRPDLTICGRAMRFEQVALLDAAPLASRILVGTDDIPSRWFVQDQRPEWLGIGATAHCQVVVSEHSPGQGCAGCLHPEDDDVDAPIPTISFVSYWAGLLLAARLLRHVAGDRTNANHQAVEVSALRAGARRGIWRHPVLRSKRCPLKCGAFES